MCLRLLRRGLHLRFRSLHLRGRTLHLLGLSLLGLDLDLNLCRSLLRLSLSFGSILCGIIALLSASPTMALNRAMALTQLTQQSLHQTATSSQIEPTTQQQTDQQTRPQTEQQTPPPSANKGQHQSYAEAVRRAGPAVVNVYTRDQSVDKELPPYPSPKRKSSPQLKPTPTQPNPAQKFRYRLGSGVIMNKQGYIITNFHVVQHAKLILVALSDGRRVPAQLIGTDPQTDLAVVRVQLQGLDPIPLGNSKSVRVGDVVLAIGNPFGLGQTVTQGIVSAIGRSTVGINELENYIQTDAAINPGNSGGALINSEGQLIGISAGLYSRSGGYQGVGFAIPVNAALNIMDQIIKHGEVKRGWLGLGVKTLTPAMVHQLKLKTTVGVLVVKVEANSPAQKMGIRRYDVITQINQNPIMRASGFSSVIAQTTPGEMITLRLLQEGQWLDKKVQVKAAPAAPFPDDRMPQKR